MRIGKKGIENEFGVASPSFQCSVSAHELTHKHNIENLTAKNGYAIFGFGLAHAPNQPLGLDRKNTVIGKCSPHGSHNAQQAVWRNGGCGSYDKILIIR